MYYKFQLENDEFCDHYHKQRRDNVHMLKTTFVDSVNTKIEGAQFNETLLKIFYQNVVV